MKSYELSADAETRKQAIGVRYFIKVYESPVEREDIIRVSVQRIAVLSNDMYDKKEKSGSS